MGGIFHEFLSFFREKNAGVPPGSGFQVQITGLFHPAYCRVDRGFCGAGLFVKNTLIAAGAVVIEDVPAGAVVAGSPARIVKMKDEKTQGKTALVDALRKL